MATQQRSRSDDVQEILMNAVEVQLAAFTAGIGFWSAWVEQAREFSEKTIRLIAEMQANPSDTNRVLLEMTDVSRASLRALTDLPRRTAEGFIDALGEFEKARKPVPKPTPAGKAAKKKAAKKKSPRRAVRAKP